MKVAIVGGGPAGLYFAYLMRRYGISNEVVVIEQNAPDATYGFGVVFSDAALTYLEDADTESYETIRSRMEIWDDLAIVHKDRRVPIDGNGFTGIARIALLSILQSMCRSAGVRLAFNTRLDCLSNLADYDLIVGADGIGSMVRETYATHFQPRISHLTNRFAWYGTRQPFDTLTLTFRQNEHGAFVAHHYRYQPDFSTFIVECDESTWQESALGDMSEVDSLTYCSNVFAPDLGGHGLVANKSIWRRFPVVTNQNWTHQNIVLIGDALRSVHFSIGSGTRLALEDSIALFRAFETCGTDVTAGLAEFERQRRPIVDKLLAAAANSFEWYEGFAKLMPLSAHELAYNYMTRSGRVDDDKLRQLAPRFMASYDAERHANG
ncbi:MAG: FAD-dependent monooxygenase [Pseudomonadota bacterium]